VTRFVAELRRDGIPLTAVYLFGSHAAGRAHKESDIDVCVVSPRFRSRWAARRYLWNARRPIDVRIEPVGYPPRDFVNEDPLVWEIKRTGIKIV